ncbi:MAG: DUF192 domain-containing protein [Deltaproteobacteria bacterium]|nr:DUF192 domain-containing protein [Deltaproteobacteria bacterium]
MRTRLWIFIALMFAFAAPACGSEGLTSVKILSPEGKLRHEFQAELARTPAEHSQGLMYRSEMEPDHGMLFVFPKLNQTPFWMKNTLIPLDMVFIGPDKKIVSIVERATPQTTSPREAAGPYQYVLEINGGKSETFGIHAGDRVEFQEPR